MKITITILGLLAVALFCACKQPVQQTGNDNPPVVVNEVKNTPKKKARNIILLIGDGMGLAQITAGMYTNNNKTSLERFPVVGLHKSHAHNDLVTDSAAGATAFASGVKTVNGAIGVDHMGAIHETVLEEAERRGLATGMVVTSTIVHATPAAFASHVPNRRLYEEIALQYMFLDIDVLIGGGKAFFDRRSDGKDLYKNLRRRNYLVEDYLTPVNFKELQIAADSNFVYLTADKDPLSAMLGRTYFLPAVEFTLDFMRNRSRQGFFLMIEGSQIDWGGHANNAEYILTEFDEFDEVIAMCYDFAKKDENTLVVVTADHETGGLAINSESKMRDLNIAFTTGGHTACMIPVFAFGPGSENFSGVYDNTEVHSKLRRSYGWMK